MKVESATKTSRKKKDQIELAKAERARKLLDLIRIVKAKLYFPSVMVDAEEVDWSSPTGSRDYTAKVLQQLEMALSNLPPEVAQAIEFDLSPEGLLEHYTAVASFGQDPMSFKTFSSELSTDREFFLRWASRSILESAERYERLRSHYNRIYKVLDYLEQRERVPEHIRVLIPVPEIFASSVGFADNALVLVPDELTVAFSGVDLSKLKRCPVCERVFWLFRKDQKGCTQACAHVLRTRRWREKTTAEQRSKYKANRALKEMKEEGRKQ